MVNLRMSMREMPNTQELKDFAKKANVTVAVGFLSGRQHVPKNSQSESKETAELAKELSYGTATTPARPFLEEGINSKKNELNKAMEEQVEAVKNGKNANWDKVGTMAVGAVQEFVRGDYYKSTKPNSPETIKEKGSDTPLIDTADLLNSCEYVVEA